MRMAFFGKAASRGLPSLDNVASLASLDRDTEELSGQIDKCGDADVLRRYLAFERAVPDPYWRIRIARRLNALSDRPEDWEAYVRALLFAGQAEAAIAAHDAGNGGRTPATATQELRALIAIARGDMTEALEAIQASGAAPAVKLGHYANLFDELLQRGRVDRAAEAMSLIRGMDGSTFIHASKKVALVIAIEGPSAAARTLADIETKVALTPRQRMRLTLSVLVARGRYSAAFRLVERTLCEDPKALELLPVAFAAALHADLLDDLDRLLRKVRDREGDVTALIGMKLSCAIVSEDGERAEALLNILRTRSTTLSLRAEFDRAMQSGTPEDVVAVHARLERQQILTSNDRLHFAEFRFLHARNREECDRVAADLAPDLLRNRGNPAFVSLYCRALIAAGRSSEMRAVLEDVPGGLRKRNPLASLSIYLHHLAGDEARVRSDWRMLFARELSPSLTSEEAPPTDLNVRFQGRDKEILLFSCVYNGMDYLPRFFEHYRNLGVTHFFLVDNGSTDGTADYALDQEDVSVFAAHGSFARAGSGMYWINHLMRRFGVGYWCFQVDYDEFFVFPGQEDGLSLAQFIEHLEAEGAESVASMQLDVYPVEIAAAEDRLGFERSTLIDTDYSFLPMEVPPYTLVKGGVRSRLTRQLMMMTKAPLVKMRADFAYLLNNHTHSGARMSGARTALLHYKFVGHLRARIREAIERAEHVGNAKTYKALGSSMRSDLVLKSDASTPYEGPRQLELLGYLVPCRKGRNNRLSESRQ